MRAAELPRQSAAAGQLSRRSPQTRTTATSAVPNFGTSHGTFSVAVTLNVPIFQGTRVRADTLEADAALQQRKAELADLDGRIDEQVRTAFLNLRSSSDLVTVTREQHRPRQPDARAGAGSLRRRRRQQPRRRAGAGIGGRPPTSPTSPACMRTTSRKSLSRRRSASPSSRRCNISERSNHGHSATNDPAD